MSFVPTEPDEPLPQHELLRQLVDQVPAFLWIIDRDLIVRRIEGGQPMLDTLGRDRIVGLPMEEVTRMGVTTEEDLEISVDSHRRALRGEPVRYRATWGGMTIEAHIRPLRDASGELVGVIGVGLDVTEAARAQAQLRQAQKMEALGQLAGGIAHDFNNILAAITAYAQLVHDDLPANLPSRADVAEIIRAAERAADITRQLLVFSSRQVLTSERLDLVAVVQELARMLRTLTPASLTVEVRPPTDGEPVWVVANRAQLEQVVVNLVVNARDALPSGGVVSIAVHRGDTVAGAHTAVLEVRDDGIGMSPDLQARVFEPFFTTKEPGRGTGLGLATVYGIVRQYDGSIDVRSVEGSGTTVTVRLPTAPEGEAIAAVPVERPAERAPSGGPRRVLVVEDEEQVRAVTGRILERAGYGVLDAPSADDALRLLAESDPVDLVLTDAALPGMHGEDFAAEIGRAYPGTPVVLMSGFAEFDDGRAQPGTTPPVAAFVQKPFRVEHLLATIHRVLSA